MAATTVTTSSKFSLNLNDWWKGLIMAVVAPLLKIIMDLINSGSLTFDWLALGKLALAAGAAYILKNLFTPAKIVISGATAETIADVKSGDIDVKVGTTIAKVVVNAPPNNP